MATMSSCPEVYLTMSARIIQEAVVQYYTKFNSYCLIELADHNYLSESRCQVQLILHNKYLWEIQMS